MPPFFRVTVNTKDLKRLQSFMRRATNVPTVVWRRAASAGVVYANRVLRRAAPTRRGRGRGGIGAKYPLRRNIRVRAVKSKRFRSRTSFSRASAIVAHGMWLDSGTHLRVRKSMVVRGTRIFGAFSTGSISPSRWISKAIQSEVPRITDRVLSKFQEGFLRHVGRV